MTGTTGVRFTEQLDGWLSFDAADYNQALLAGKRAGISARMHLEIAIADLTAFIDGPEHVGRGSGWVRCDELGGRLDAVAGRFELFAAEPDARHRRMRYRLHLNDPAGRPLTLTGFKLLEDDPNFDSWRDVTTLFIRVFAGHVDAAGETTAGTVATGVLRLSALGFLRELSTFRGTGGTVASRFAAVLRFQRYFLRTLMRTYRGRPVPDGRPSFPRDRAARIPPASLWEPVPAHAGVRRRVVGYAADDGFALTLHHLRGTGEPTRGPVLLSHGAGLRAQVFYGQPSGRSLADVLLEAGYDVWAQNWRGSIDVPPNRYTLDRVARYDHPAAVRAVLQETQTPALKAIVHCQGSVSFTMAAVAGRLPEVTHVVSSAVSLHLRVPPATRVKQLVLVPPAALLTPHMDAQWGIRAPALPGGGLAAVARMIRRECDNPVCAMASYMYGTGPDLLWRHRNVAPDVHAWMGRELGFAPFRLLRQLVRSTGAGHVVPAERLPGMPADYLDAPPDTDARFTFLVGSENRMFLPEGQRASFEHFDAHAPGRHEFRRLDGVGHLDTLVGRSGEARVFPAMLAGLER